MPSDQLTAEQIEKLSREAALKIHRFHVWLKETKDLDPSDCDEITEKAREVFAPAPQLAQALREREAMREQSFAAVCDRVCRDLPEGWSIIIELQKDSGVIVLEDENAEGVDFPTNNEKFEQTLQDALEAALSPAASQGGG